MDDMWAKGRGKVPAPRIGEGNNSTTLTAPQVAFIKAYAKPGDFNKFAIEFSVDRTTISNIVSGKTWGHISPKELNV